MTRLDTTTKQFFAHLHRGGNWAYWWTDTKKLSFWFPVEKYQPFPHTKENIYFGVHPTAKPRGKNHRARNEDIVAINCFFADFDAKDFEDDKARVLAHIETLPIASSVIIDSGGGYHCYWLLRETFVITNDREHERARKVQQNWVKFVDGDRGAKDLARVLRVPGTLNYKYDPPRRAEFVRADFERVYSLDELEAALPRVEPPDSPNPLPTRIPSKGHSRYALAAFIDELEKLARTNELARNDQLNKSAFALGQLVGAGMLDRNDVEARLLDVAHTIGLGECETHATIKSGIEAGMREPRTLPMNGNGHGKGAPASSKSEIKAVSTLETQITELGQALERIPADVDKIRLPILLPPILQDLAKLDKAVATTFLCRAVKSRFALTYAEIRAYESDLVTLRETWERAEKERRAKEALAAQAEAAKPKAMSEAEHSEAMAFLQSPRLVAETIADLTDLGYVGEDDNKLLVYCIATSRRQDKPLSATVKSPSAYGKSELVKTVAALMPPEDVLEFTRLTPQALAYMPPDALKNKWLVIMERNGSEEADYNIRIMQSEGKIRIAYPVKDPDTGEMHTVEREVAGPLAYTETTTRPTIHAENATRVFELYLDGGRGQTQRIHASQRRGVTLNGLRGNKKRAEIIRRHQNAQRLLQPSAVVIPYAEFIQFPAENPRTRRDFPRFLETIKVIAFLRQYQKARKQDVDAATGQVIEYIEADLNDYAVAYQYAAPVIAYGLDELPKLARDLFERIGEMVKTKIAVDVNGEKLFSRRDVRKHCRVTDKFIWDYIPLLEDKEYLTIVSGGKGKKYVYKLPETFQEDAEGATVKGLTTPTELAEAIELAKAKKCTHAQALILGR